MAQAGMAAEPMRALGPPPPGRSLANPGANAAMDVPSGVQRALSAIRAALPFVQRLLPLLDGNIGAAVSNMLTPVHHATPQPPPPPPVDLAPIEQGLTELQTQQKELRGQVMEQNSSLKRVEDQLEMVREATDRNTLEQQELLEDLKVVGNKVNLFALDRAGTPGALSVAEYCSLPAYSAGAAVDAGRRGCSRARERLKVTRKNRFDRENSTGSMDWHPFWTLSVNLGRNCPILHQGTIIVYCHEYDFDTFRSLYPSIVICCYCQSYFRGASIRHSSSADSSENSRPFVRYAVIPLFTELHQRAALIGARARSVSSWHGMPTASVKNKPFLN